VKEFISIPPPGGLFGTPRKVQLSADGNAVDPRVTLKSIRPQLTAQQRQELYPLARQVGHAEISKHFETKFGLKRNTAKFQPDVEFL
jgi:hypothetical protein